MTIDAPGEEARSLVPCCWSGRGTPTLSSPEDISVEDASVEDTWNSRTPDAFSAWATTHHLSSSWLALSVAWAGTKPPRSPLVRTGSRASGRDGQCHTTGTCNEATKLHERSLLSWCWHRYFQWALMYFRHALGGCPCIPHQGVLIYTIYSNPLL